MQKTPVEILEVDESELKTWLTYAQTIYKLQPLDPPSLLLVLNINQQKNINQYYHIINIKNLDKILGDYSYIKTSGGIETTTRTGKVYSPNGSYYYIFQDKLGIYDVINDQLLAEFGSSINFLNFGTNSTGGWAFDNSGVYFQESCTGGFVNTPPKCPIQKLCVPGTVGCSSEK